MNESHRSAMLGMKGRPTVAEDIAVYRDIALAEYADAKVHVAHISSGRSVELVRQAYDRPRQHGDRPGYLRGRAALRRCARWPRPDRPVRADAVPRCAHGAAHVVNRRACFADMHE